MNPKAHPRHNMIHVIADGLSVIIPDICTISPVSIVLFGDIPQGIAFLHHINIPGILFFYSYFIEGIITHLSSQ